MPVSKIRGRNTSLYIYVKPGSASAELGLERGPVAPLALLKTLAVAEPEFVSMRPVPPVVPPVGAWEDDAGRWFF